MQKILRENDGNRLIKPRGHTQKAEFIKNRGGDEGSCWYRDPEGRVLGTPYRR